MTVTTSKVILHIPKTAGSSVRWAAIAVDKVHFSAGHGSYRTLPKKYRNLDVVSFIREPLDWYVSFYEYSKGIFEKLQGLPPELQKNQRTGMVFFEVLSNGYTKSFQETLPLVMNLTKTFNDNPLLFQSFRTILIDSILNLHRTWWTTYFDDLQDITPETFNNKSLYEWFYDIIEVRRATVYRIEDQYEFGMKKEFGENINIQKRNVNENRKRDLDEYYTPELKEMVYEADKFIIEKYYKDYKDFNVRS